LTRQNVAIGGLALDAGVGATRLDVLGLRRFDVTGTVSGAGGRALRLGGNAAVSELASVIRVAANPDGTGGRLLLTAGGSLELNGQAIGVGQDAVFLTDLGLKAGATPLAKELVASQFIGNANSSLYSSIIGGAPYNPPGQTIVSATKLSVRFNDYALFQNTGTAGTTTGAVIGTTTASPTLAALVITGAVPPEGRGFAIFGTINETPSSATSLLGEAIIVVKDVDRANLRINGCLVSSGGGGCLVSTIVQPTLQVFDTSRTDIFKTSPDFEIPFEPLVATNNEALFSDVGTFGLGDIPIGPASAPTPASGPVCTDPNTCPKKDNK
jgi:hypothetical protein